MEKRFFTAVILSFLVLIIWSKISPQQYKSSTQPDNQIIKDVENKDIIISNELTSNEENLSINSTILPEKEKISQLKTKDITIDFTNIGGKISKITLNQFNQTLPLKDLTTISEFNNATFSLKELTDKTIKYTYEVNDLIVSKIYRMSNDGYGLEMDTFFHNKSLMSKNIDFDVQSMGIDMSILNMEDNQRDRNLFEYVINSSKGIKRKANAYKFNEKDDQTHTYNINWVAFRDRYFCVIIKPNFNTIGYSLKALTESYLRINISPEEFSLLPEEKKNLSYKVYIGPERLDILKDYDKDFPKIKRYYKLGLFDIIAKLINKLLHFIHNWVPNWGLCIIIISIIIYFSMFPLTLKGMKSMKKMQEIAPQMNALKEKHKDNPQKMNKEVMEIYRKNKINPVSGCLPMLLQMPVFIGLYQVLWRNVSFKGEKFLWINDLTEPDKIFKFPFEIPFVGEYFNILPIFMMVIMYFQQKISVKNLNVTDPIQIQQQKMMSNIMPIFMGVIFYKFASGLTLYFTMFYLFSTFTQFKMSSGRNEKIAH